MNKKPLILDFQTILQEYPNTPVYQYDHTQYLNVIDLNGQKVPFINIEHPIAELDTKTRVINEQDDERRQIDPLIDSSDRGHSNAKLLELETKTKVKIESDDFHHSYAELETKTFVKNESDDQKDPYHN